jgi:hypothetical protein
MLTGYRTLVVLLGSVTLWPASALASDQALRNDPRFSDLMAWCRSGEQLMTANCVSYIHGVIGGRAALESDCRKAPLCYRDRHKLLDTVVTALNQLYDTGTSANLHDAPAAVVIQAVLDQDFSCAMRAAAKFEVRGARFGPQAGLTETRMPVTGGKIFVASEALLTNQHLRGAEVHDAHDGAQVLIRLTNEGSRLFRAWSALNVGQPVAIFVDGDLVAVPLLRDAAMEGGLPGMLLAGRNTRDHAEKLARLINVTRLAPVLREGR